MGKEIKKVENVKTKKELIELFHALTSAVKRGSVTFKLAVFRNLKQIDSEIEFLKSIETEIEELLKEYRTKYYQVIEKYGTKKGDQFIIEKDNENFDKVIDEIKVLEDEYKETIELYNSKQNDYNKVLDSAIDFKFTAIEIKEELLPSDLTDIELKQMLEFGIFKL